MSALQQIRLELARRGQIDPKEVPAAAPVEYGLAPTPTAYQLDNPLTPAQIRGALQLTGEAAAFDENSNLGLSSPQKRDELGSNLQRAFLSELDQEIKLAASNAGQSMKQPIQAFMRPIFIEGYLQRKLSELNGRRDSGCKLCFFNSDQLYSLGQQCRRSYA